MVNISKAIAVSSDTFFYRVAWDMGIDRIHPLVGQFGLGQKTGIDLDGEASGVLPSKEWKEKRFARFKPEVRRWYPADVVSVGIGQGFNAYTPLQMANATAILAADGKVFKPHLVQEITQAGNGKVRLVEPRPVRTLAFRPELYGHVKDGMVAVMRPGGTAARLAAGLTYTMAGKTGTAQVVQIKQGAKYNAAALAEQYRDHSWFIAFAPVEAPRIAIAVIVENAGFGAASAAPIARAVSDFALTGKVPAELQGKLITMPQPAQAGDKQDASAAR
jgi:penicillin-binding protein 2